MSSLPATQEKSPNFSVAAAKSPKTGQGDKPCLAPEDDSKAEDKMKTEVGLGVSNGGTISAKTQKDTRKILKDTAEATSRQAKTKKLSKEERKMARCLERNQTPQPREEGADGDPVDIVARNYGDLPLEFFERLPVTASPRSWTEVRELVLGAAGRAVLLRGWVQSVRSVGKKLVFFILRDGLATVQCVLVRGDSVTDQMIRFADDLPKESFIEVEGLISQPIKPVSYTTQQVEIAVEKIYCISRSTNNLPFNFEDAVRSQEEMNRAECRGERLPQVTVETRLDNRILDLRTPTSQSIFQIQSLVDSKFTEFLLSKGFMGIHTPKITPGISEGGSSVFQLSYVNGQSASLAQSPQLYKQMAINSGFKKVFEVGTIFRAEKSNTHRHLCEYIGLHVEMEIKEHYFEVCDVLGELFVELFDHLAEKCKAELEIINKQFPCEPLKYLKETLKLRYAEGIDMLKDSGFQIEHCDDLSTQAEKKLGQLVLDKYNTDFFILYEFPLTVRPFYTMPCLERPEYCNSFDAFIRGEEVVSGSQRIHSSDLLRRRIRECRIDPSGLKEFANSFLYGAPPRGGFGAGLERIVMLYCGIPNIRLVSLFPRDPQRLTP